MRLFLAINLPGDVKGVLAKELPRFLYLKYRTVPEENWHVTLKFIGEVDASLLPMIKDAVNLATSTFKSFELTVESVGFLNRRIFAFKLERSPKLFALFRLIDERLAALRICVPERFRTFHAHITIGRKNPPISHDLHAVRHFHLKTRDVVTFTALSIDLMESALAPEGAKYKVLHSFPFRTEKKVLL